MTSLSMRNCISWNNYSYFLDGLSVSQQIVDQLEWNGIDGVEYRYAGENGDLKEVSDE